RRTRPYTPRTNGKAERFIRTLLREWAYGPAFHSSAQRTAALDRWLHYYNWHRRHRALGGAPPISRVVRSDDLLSHHTYSAITNTPVPPTVSVSASPSAAA